MVDLIDAALDAFRCGKNKVGQQLLTDFMKESGCSEHVRTIAEFASRAFNEKSKASNSLLYMDMVHAPRHPEMLPVVGGLSKACSAEFRLFSLNEDNSLKGVVDEFVVRYRLFVPASGSVGCRCHPS